ncbi:MAG: hypothetical protein HC915_11745 [Anaerolineae bacterium]|nr:hypothetical protein [Anaerolineae bacterium]
MRRFLASLLISLVLGIGAGVFLGWTRLPVEEDAGALCQLSRTHREDYTVMVARGYQGMLAQGIDANEGRIAAMRNLLPLNADYDLACQQADENTIDNIPAWVQEVTERALSSGEDLQDICDLAALSAAFGRQIPGYADRPGTVCDQFHARAE